MAFTLEVNSAPDNRTPAIHYAAPSLRQLKISNAARGYFARTRLAERMTLVASELSRPGIAKECSGSHGVGAVVDLLVRAQPPPHTFFIAASFTPTSSRAARYSASVNASLLLFAVSVR